jgi:hypothetical protein
MRIAFDSHVVTFFLQANQYGYDPAEDGDSVLATERVAAFRLWIYGSNPIAVPTVFKECKDVPDAMKNREHFNWNAYHLEEVLAQELDAAQIDARVAELAILHSGANDCRIVAECEDKAARVDALATFDSELIKHLKDEARIVVATPYDCWQRLAIPHGAAPSSVLSADHPLVKVVWWRW